MSNHSLSLANFSSEKRLKMPGCIKEHSQATSLCVLPLVVRVPPSVVLGVGWVAAVRRGVGALSLASLAPPPPWCLGNGAPHGCMPAIPTPSLSRRAHLSCLAPVGNAVEFGLSQQGGLDARGPSSHHTELLYRNDNQQRKKKERKKKQNKEKKGKKRVTVFSNWWLSATVYLPTEGKHLKEKRSRFSPYGL